MDKVLSTKRPRAKSAAPSRPTKPSRAEAEAAIRTLIRWAGDDPDREGLRATPARVVRAYHYMRSTQTRLKDIALKLGYGTPRALTSEVYLVTGFLPSSLKNELEPEDLLARVAARLWRHGCPADIVVPDVPAGLSSNAPRPGSRR